MVKQNIFQHGQSVLCIFISFHLKKKIFWQIDKIRHQQFDPGHRVETGRRKKIFLFSSEAQTVGPVFIYIISSQMKIIFQQIDKIRHQPFDTGHKVETGRRKKIFSFSSEAKTVCPVYIHIISSQMKIIFGKLIRPVTNNFTRDTGVERRVGGDLVFKQILF